MQAETIELLQRATLAHASMSLSKCEIVFGECDVADFPPGHLQEIASLLVSMLNNGEFIDNMTVHTRTGEHSVALQRVYDLEVMGQEYGSPQYVANKVRQYADRDRLVAALTRATQSASSTSEIQDILARLEQDLAVLQRPDDLANLTLTLDDILAVPDEDARWIMQNMLRVNERLMFTGMEGGGKSVLLAQIAIGAAMGVHTLSQGLEQHEPVRTLVLDVENSLIQVRNNARKIHPILAEMTGRDSAPLEWINERYIDLADPKDAARIIRIAKEKRPQLMFMGSVYKLAAEGERFDASFNAITRTVDRIRAETGAAVVLEAHTGHGFNNDRSKGSGMRPDGSSRWMRWPEMGYGMVPMGKQYPGITELVPFRGMRDDSYIWPKGLKRSNVLPWAPIMADEWEARYARD